VGSNKECTVRKRIAYAMTIAVVLLAGCGGSTPTPTPTPTPTTTTVADLPPLWVQQEVSWQALAAGDAHPRSCRWTLAPASRAVGLDSQQLSYMRGPSSGKVYVAIVQGDFRPTYGDLAGSARFMYLVMDAHSHHLTWGFLSTQPHVRALGHLHAYRPTLPLTSGIWGHAMFGGGPIPGVYPIAHVPVGVWRGAQKESSGAPLKSVSSDANGFFKVALPDGVYTLKLLSDKHGWVVPTTVTVRAGMPVAAGVFGEGM
jgi:hypothetical protein